MKRILTATIVIVMMFALVACNSNVEQPAVSSATSSEATISFGNAENRVTVEPVPGSSDMAITVLNEYLDENATQQDYDAEAAQKGWTSATINADKSVRYVMSEEKRQEELKTIDAAIRDDISKLVPTPVYPNFSSIDANNDFTKFTVHCSSTGLSMKELQIVLKLYSHSGLYNSFNGTAGRSCIVSFIDDATGNEIRQAGMII